MSDDDIEVWADATAVSSMYEQQVSRAGRWRHRRLNIRALDSDLMLGRPRGIGEWQPGPAPDTPSDLQE